MEFDIAIVSVIVTILIALLGLAYNAGVLSTKVKLLKEDMGRFLHDNREDHKAINLKLDTIIRNGNGR